MSTAAAGERLPDEVLLAGLGAGEVVWVVVWAEPAEAVQAIAMIATTLNDCFNMAPGPLMVSGMLTSISSPEETPSRQAECRLT